MQLSRRIRGLTGGSDGWDVFYRARAMKEAGADVTELTIGEHDIGTAPDILDKMYAAARAGMTGYATVAGNADLRRAVARRVEAQTGVPTSAENVLICTGGQAALFACHHLACDHGDAALFIDPYYATYPGTIRGAGAVPVPVRARAEDDFQPRAEAIDAAADAADRPRSLMINSPNNPTGAVYSEATMDGIASVCRARDLWLISDEVYDAQVWEGRHISPRALPGMSERTLVVGSMSKSHAMTGSRIGWIVGPHNAIELATDLATHSTYGVPGYIQAASAWALSRGAEVEETVAAPFRRRRDAVAALMEGQQVVRMVPAQGAMYTMLDIRATGMSGEAFANLLLDEEAVAVMPGESFGKAAAGHLRVALTVADDRLIDALKRLLALARRRVAAKV